MIRLALIGKNISHSKSAEIYRSLLKKEIDYKLIDCKSEIEIPKIECLLKDFDGISITSPYKKHFVDDVEVLKDYEGFGAINCVRELSGKFQAINTDYLAVKEIIENYENLYGELEAIILGSGVMASVTKRCLELRHIPFKLFSRKDHGDISKLEIKREEMVFPSRKLVIINCCSRDFLFKGIIPTNSVFWDHNYNFSEQRKLISDRESLRTNGAEYIDGTSLLRIQAVYALSFWNIE